LGMYPQSVAILKQGLERFPDAQEFPVFLAMALYNIGEYKQAVSDLLKLLLTVSDHPTIQRYQAAIALYADDLDKTWLEED
ncbi:MAG: tetratricopeptide repeat protein, partial [Phototrophicaceae bacterium]